ncbi:SH3 domain and tetratricopeptide repeat-containing protein 1 [Eucyclogobius newberryi]|uniref:SH3 domain and tetratricopeptide repeat-containing protein 1 n=1 Tax=Eucyclogobius newberryi TaxID=166745 RepID=UPI003B5C8452
MSAASRRGAGSSRSRRTSSGDGQQQRERPRTGSRSGTMVRGLSRDVPSLKRALSVYEDSTPAALPLLLDMVRGPERLPAEEELQEMLRGKLRVLQADSEEVTALFMELSAHLLSISPEDKVIFVTFKTFEEIWKFNTYYTIGFLGHCLENVLFDPKLWLQSVEEDVSAEISFQQDTLNLIFKGILMQEGSFFASCSANQMFDSSMSGGDLYLEQGDIAQFEPPFLGAGWSVRCLADGARGTAPKPSLEPVPAFHQWFLKSCPESILVGDGKPLCIFPLQFARGSCLATEEYDADGAGELSITPNDHIVIVGLLVSCFDWFVGRKERTGEVGLVKTNLVKPEDAYNSEDVFLYGEDQMFFRLQEDKVIEETLDLLKKKQNLSLSYKLDTMPSQDQRKKSSFMKTENAEHEELKMHIQRQLTVPLTSEEPHSPTDPASISPSKTPNASCPRFFVPHIVEGKNHTEDLMPLFTFLENQNYNEDYGVLYGLTPDQLCSSTFTGHADEAQLTSFLSVARETARKKRLFWSQTRICFLLGKLCIGRSKFSQARVYFEEALSVPREGFTDFRLLTNIYYNLARIYLLQKNTDSFFLMTERLVALLMAFSFCLDIVEEDSILKHILKKAILSNNKQAEARASYLLAKHYWMRMEKDDVIPYIERLLVLFCEDTPTCSISPSCGYLTLGGLYNELDLANLSACSFRRTSLDPSTTITNSLSCIVQLGNNLAAQQEPSFPCRLAPYLHNVLSLPELQETQNVRHHMLSHHLTVCLSEMFSKHQMLEQAVQYMHELLEASPSARSVPASQVNSALIWLAWLHIEQCQPDVALDILELILASIPEHCTSPQEGEVLNLCGVALCSMGDLRRAVEHYQAAIDISQEYEDLPNWAVAQANLGLLCLKAGATALAQTHLTEAVQIFSELDTKGHEESFITVLLELGKLYVKQGQVHYGKGCYEWALLLSISANLLDCELGAASQLCRLYSSESPDQAQCILYSLHRLQLLQRTGDRALTALALETLSRLYLSLGTHKAYTAALDYTKSSLGMFIDMGLKEKEAYGWLQAGKIYHLLGQTELVDLYIQAAQEVALSTGDTKSILCLLEAAGDIFFNSEQDRDKAITFYRDRALPIAAKTNSVRTRLRLCNKLTELMLTLKMFGDAVEYAQTALDISLTLSEHLNVRVAYHRLAALYHCLQQFELAEHFYLKTLALCPSPLQFDEETLYYVRVYQTLGDIIFYDVKDPFDAAGYYHVALAAALDLGNKKSQLQLCTRLATIYHNFLMDREQSLLFYQRARALAAELNIKRVNISPEQPHSSTSMYKTTSKSN